MIVLRDYFELSGQPVHKTVVHDHFLTIPDEFGADSERNIGGISIGLFFPFDMIICKYLNHYVKSALKERGRTGAGQGGKTK